LWHKFWTIWSELTASLITSFIRNARCYNNSTSESDFPLKNALAKAQKQLHEGSARVTILS
jgi:hypothetical protein